MFKNIERKIRLWNKFKKNFYRFVEICDEDHYHIKNLKYEIYDEILNGTALKSIPKVKSIEETIDDIIKNKKSVCRFGDGEFYTLIDKMHDENYGHEGIKEALFFKSSSTRLKNIYYKQARNENLVNKLREILKSDAPDIGICVPGFWGSLKDYSPKEKQGLRRLLGGIREDLNEYLLFDNKVYGNAMFTRVYSEKSQCICVESTFKKIREIWEDKEVVLVEGEGTRFGYGNDLLDNALSVERVLCPAQGAFDKYDEIFEYTKKLPKNKLILSALGMTATVLSYDLAKEGFQAIDIGHLDTEYEWFLMKATNLPVAVPNKFTNEVGAFAFPPITDEKYISQIIKKIL